MAQITSYDKRDRKLVSVTFQLTSDSEKEVYRKFLEKAPELKCSKCGKVFTPDEIEEYTIRVYNPLNPVGILGFAMGAPFITCPDCDHTTELVLMDIEAFPDIMVWLNKLKSSYEKNQKAMNARGVRKDGNKAKATKKDKVKYEKA